MPRLENDKFLSELTKLYQSAETSGNVVITMKKYDGRTKPEPRKGSKSTRKRTTSAAEHHHHHHEVDDHQCLIRAVKGNKKISTVVPHKEVNRFQLSFANLLRGNMTSLKKKGKSKSDTRNKQLAA